MIDYLTTKDLCGLLKVSRTAIANWRKEGMPFEKYGKIVRFDKDEVLVWLKSRNKNNE